MASIRTRARYFVARGIYNARNRTNTRATLFVGTSGTILVPEFGPGTFFT